MKSIYRLLTLCITLLVTSLTIHAQNDGATYHSEHGISTAKTVSKPDVDGNYTIKLETFATGASAITETGIPVDIVLVLDVSGSMNDMMYNYYPTTRDWSYNSVGSTERYYKHTDGNYYLVYRYGNNNNRYLYFQVQTGTDWWGYPEYTTYFLNGTGAQTNWPVGKGNDQTIFTGTLSTRTEKGTKISALKTAVTTFVNEVHHNALYDTDENLRGTPLDNQISIVKFANDRYYGNSVSSIAEGNHHGRGVGSDSVTDIQDGDYNYTEVLKQFKDVSTDAGVNSLLSVQNGVEALVAGGGTAAHYGMTKAKYLLDKVKDRESTKVVVFFTDGIPGMTGWDNNFANGAIDAAKDIKKATDQGGYGAIIYSVGVFDNLGSDETNATNYMNYVSSNYPNAASMTNGGSGSNQGYYQDASNADLTAIFKDIASAASQSESTVGASTQVRDVVSSSFILPADTDPNDITVYSLTITEDGDDWGDRDDLSTTGQDPDVTVVIGNNTCSDGVVRKMLSVEGFDFSQDDIRDADGYTTRENAGNWVGKRYKSKNETFWAGKKLVIEFLVKANGEATGGEGTNTNHPDSGVYVQKFDEDGNPVLVDGKPVYENLNHYPVPHTTLPLILKITKTGLRHGESATFEVHMFDPLKDDDGNIQYNAIGKPKPDPATERNWSKVVLTNKGADGDPVEKVIMAMDPHYVYSVIEDDWAWAYDLTEGTASTITTSDMEVNPFHFKNKGKDNVVKHAEAVSINHFATSGTANDAHEEHYNSKEAVQTNSSSGSTGSETGGTGK